MRRKIIKLLENKTAVLTLALVFSVMVNALFLIGWLGVLLSVSAIINIGLFWYIWRVIHIYKQHTINLAALLARLYYFADHVEDIYNLETFYGDETLKGLLEHAREIVLEVRNFKDEVIPEEPDKQFLVEKKKEEEIT